MNRKTMLTAVAFAAGMLTTLTLIADGAKYVKVRVLDNDRDWTPVKDWEFRKGRLDLVKREGRSAAFLIDFEL